MPAPKRPIRKPRVSLSCIVCRRRKVRCGREQPECANCVRMQETCVYQAMRRDESTGRVRPASPQDHPGRSSEPTACPIPAPLQRGRGHLSLRRGGQVRYIGPTFWGLVAGKESLSDDFFDESRHVPPGLPLPHISSMSMLNLLRSLPTKPVSDALLESFFGAVWPLSPLLHLPSLQTDYDRFWDWCRHSGSAMPPEDLREDPSWFCLLFAVLYCGASAAPVASWTAPNLQGLQKETTVSQLERAYTTCLSLCRHLEHPTMHTLVSTLLTGPFRDRPFEPMRNLVQRSTTVRVAQLMGLHRGDAWSALSPVDQGIRRRVWWHIVGLDVQSSIATGMDLCCGPEALEAVRMVDDAADEAMIYATGRSLTARVQARLVADLQNPQGPTKDGRDALVADATQLLQNLDALLGRVPTLGIPESSDISSRLAGDASPPFTHPPWYTGDASQPTVFAAWTRIMLTLLKSEVAILLRKAFLVPPDRTNPQSRTSWMSLTSEGANSIAQLCLKYLRVYLQLSQTPAFSPYAWFCCSHHGPLQCVFIILTYLTSFSDSEDALLFLSCVDETLHHFKTHCQIPGSSPPTNEGKMRVPSAIQVLVELRERLDSSLGVHSAPSSTTGLLVTANIKAGPPKSAWMAEGDSGLDMSPLAPLLDLEAWASSLIMGSDSILGPF
ncbi:C6 zinc finger domain protein [Aspergillus clavatus NRRL 1]|uniref:C6 zinc finger domain protein n=1 Tax=Aspergillus clavatus (strain ATCC 1007 / CBS 513.65 / DSM 816 / NCTC 3887 / NRRL 1 / QM 1276 / 107) TaxID=344612 RepID=A1CK32_ASPCL|nr:C6 zinc finger domain protein [Aspergillus clavatus NRRL 1]EAW09506.1 C6 zinc finger domain protein [Aspergillus clavatus NRRL 1]